MQKYLEEIAKEKIGKNIGGVEMTLQDEISKTASQIFRDSYQMSIGELINLYRDAEMDIHPEFQRVYRWNDYQKTKLIESIMLNIPIPSIFVSQSDDGTWDVIDGVQRLSTIFHFVGILKDNEGKVLPKLILQRTDYLPSFDKMQWENSDEKFSFTKDQQLYFKRSRLDITIMKKESDPDAKYELFQRLNTGGTLLSDQEVRNCLMIMSNRSFYEFVNLLRKNSIFEQCIPITDRKTDEQYGMELVLRLLIAFEIDWGNSGKYQDLAQLLDKEVLKVCEKDAFPYEECKRKFEKTFELLYKVFGEDVFRKFKNNKYTGAFLSSAFQVIAVGVYTNIDDIEIKIEATGVNWLISKVNEVYTEEVFIKYTTPGARAIPRYMELSIFGIEYFKP